MSQFRSLVVALLSATFGAAGASVVQAAPVTIMDATHHNGSFTNENNGPWSSGPPATPTGWTGTSPLSLGYIVAEGAMNYYPFEGWNNTGVQVTANTQYTVSANANASSGLTVILDVIATQNADGSGASVDLAHATFSGGDQAGANYSSQPTLFSMGPTTGAPTTGSIAGYYVQVRMSSDQNVVGYYWMDNIVVTSEAVPEPTAMFGVLVLGAGLLVRRKGRAFLRH